mmetsp:Transcript_4194/g.10764  ORF Transcript_4194/g.10764 Transcript_4194/m.10764 type:complete len:369 (-) Transcript_4194:46-1152(-)
MFGEAQEWKLPEVPSALVLQALANAPKHELVPLCRGKGVRGIAFRARSGPLPERHAAKRVPKRVSEASHLRPAQPSHAPVGNQPHAVHLVQTFPQDFIPCRDARIAQVNLQVRPVEEGLVDGIADVRGAHDVHVRIRFELVKLSQQCIDRPDPIRGLPSLNTLPPRHRQRLHFIDENEDQARPAAIAAAIAAVAGVAEGQLRQVPDLLEEFGHELATLAEPLAEERVRVDLDEPREADIVRRRRHGARGHGEVLHAELVGEGLAEARLACPRWAVEQDQPVPGDDVAVDPPLREEQRAPRVVQQLPLHVRVELQMLPQPFEMHGREEVLREARDVLVPFYLLRRVVEAEPVDAERNVHLPEEQRHRRP